MPRRTTTPGGDEPGPDVVAEDAGPLAGAEVAVENPAALDGAVVEAEEFAAGPDVPHPATNAAQRTRETMIAGLRGMCFLTVRRGQASLDDRGLPPTGAHSSRRVDHALPSGDLASLWKRTTVAGQRRFRTGLR